jgi:hypothetical protein
MSDFHITWAAQLAPDTTRVLVPTGLTTPEASVTGLGVSGGQTRMILEATTGQPVLDLVPEAETLTVTWRFSKVGGDWPEGLFTAHPSRHTRAAEALLTEVAAIAPHLDGVERATAIARATAERFTYGHPEKRFTDGLDEIPALGCDIAVGSCVDINTYFLAALRGAGFEAGYVTGFFFPEEKQGRCDDGHCWVVTRIDGDMQAWDIAHHLKQGTRDIRPALNPKPGFRAACFHGMGLVFPDLGLEDVKALIEPICLKGTSRHDPIATQIRLHHQTAEVPA